MQITKQLKTILANENCTLGFDATTQEGVHVNSIHVTTNTRCYSVAVDELPSGTAGHYHDHIVNSIDNLAGLYCDFTNFIDTRNLIIVNIANTLTDRCSANHAATQLINSTWDKTLNELNCHLHPLDTLSTKTRFALKKEESSIGLSADIPSTLNGNDVLQGILL